MTHSAKPWSVLLVGLLATGSPAKATDSPAPADTPAAGANVRDAGVTSDAGVLARRGAGETQAALPPDPGTAGLSTIAGIDSDGDGVRDDVQRFVILTYPDSQRMQAALLQLARGYQAWLAVPAKDADAAHAATQKTDRATECLFAVTTVDKAYAAFKELKLQVLNTDARQDVFFATDSLLSGSVFESDPEGHTGATCTFNPKALPN